MTATRIVELVTGRLQNLGIPCSVHDHVEVLTVDAWRPYVEAGPLPEAHLTKCLFLKDKKGRIYLVFALADSECDLKHMLKESKTIFPEYTGMQTLRFGDEDVLFESLAALKGAVSPLNLIHDEGPKKVNLIVDANIPLLDKDTVRLACHPGSNSMTVYLTVNELFKYIESCGHAVNIMRLSP